MFAQCCFIAGSELRQHWMSKETSITVTPGERETGGGGAQIDKVTSKGAGL